MSSRMYALTYARVPRCTSGVGQSPGAGRGAAPLGPADRVSSAARRESTRLRYPPRSSEVLI
eukprot:10879047-Alexandrium_andersonii.AAC.1